MNDIHIIAFANTKSNFSLERIKYQAEQFNMFKSITAYTEYDFDQNYWNKNKQHFDNIRGYGYWSWKPYFILRRLNEINDGEFLLYVDCGCTLNHNKKDTLINWMKFVNESQSGILSPCHGPFWEKEWTKMDLYNFINEKYNYNNTDLFSFEQTGATVILIQKRKSTIDFVEKWNDVMENHFPLCTDDPSVSPNLPCFRENRHDQSVFSMLGHIENIILVRTYEEGIYNTEKSPVIATRTHDKYTFKIPSNI